MADHIEVVADTNASFNESGLRDALSNISDEVSQSSPVSEGAPEVAVGHDAGEGTVTLRVAGHEGDFTLTSQKALLKVLRSHEGAVSPRVASGGYEADE